MSRKGIEVINERTNDTCFYKKANILMVMNVMIMNDNNDETLYLCTQYTF